MARLTLSAIVKPFGYELVATRVTQPQKFSHIDPILEEAEFRARNGDFDESLMVLQRLGS